MEQNFNTAPNAPNVPPPQSAGRQSAPPPPIYYPQPPKQRRVGTFTLGLTLILIGIIFMLSTIYQENALQYIKFAPIVMVFLGIEILIYAIRFKHDKLKYDGLSVFLVIILTIFSLSCSTVVPPMMNLVYYEKQEYQLRNQAENTFEDAISDNDYNGNVYSYAENSYDGWYYAVDGFKNEKMDMTVNVRLDDIGAEHPTKEQAAAAIDKIIKSAKKLDKSVGKIYFTVEVNSPEVEDYHITIKRADLAGMNPQTISAKIKTTVNHKETSSGIEEKYNEE